MVEEMAKHGVPQDSIAVVLDISPMTLRKHFRRELDLGAAQANVQIGKTLFEMATGGNVAAAIFWSKARMGWREKQEVDLNVRGDASNLTDEQLAAIATGGRGSRTAEAETDKD